MMAGKRPTQQHRRQQPNKRRQPQRQAVRTISPGLAFMAGALVVMVISVVVLLGKRYSREAAPVKHLVMQTLPAELKDLADSSAAPHRVETAPLIKATHPAAVITPVIDYEVQLGSYPTFTVADSERAHLILMGIPEVRVQKVLHPLSYRLSLGPYHSHAEALAVLRQLPVQFPRSKIVSNAH